ncbi:PTS system galactitol-specific IIB component [Thermoanaerobacter pentosaceus]|uniref:PTS system galactitol-specific IIB component n=1 Tax=Thermoanaerobacter pentosaceus TaxID=694059 RepID=A0ABT9M369_9THEO|nr:PTS system galactitol-specific IIB component [Thermoanaerobacter pentosaceus]
MMGQRKKIVVACGSGVATSKSVAERVKELCKQRKIDVETLAVDFRSVKSHLKDADLFISIAPYDPTDYGVPVVSGIPFMTGIGMDKAMDEIEKILKNAK